MVKTKEPICLCPATLRCSVSVFRWKAMSWQSLQFGQSSLLFSSFSRSVPPFLSALCDSLLDAASDNLSCDAVQGVRTFSPDPHARPCHTPSNKGREPLHLDPSSICKPKDGLKSPCYRSPRHPPAQRGYWKPIPPLHPRPPEL